MKKQLPYRAQEMLIKILRNLYIEKRRDEIAADAQSTLADFRAGKFQPQPVEDIIAELRRAIH